MTEILKALAWATSMLIIAFYGARLGLDHGQRDAMIVILIGAYVATMRSGCRKKGAC